MAKLSIIVPIYNAEKGIRRCIESILQQDYEDFEAILLDDGSQDGSAKILDEYALKDKRIHVVHKKNSGVSDTRNQGMRIAKGEYIQFMDADDWLAENAMKVLVNAIEESEADLVVADFYRVVGKSVSRKGSISVKEVLSLQEYSAWMMESPADYYYGVLWNKLYRKEIIDRYAVKMDEELSFCEDFVFNLEYLLHTKSIMPLAIPIYYYVKTEGSLVAKNMNLPHIVKMKTSIYEYYDQFFKKILSEEEYSAERMNIARFFISAANDDMNIALLPSTKKLGEEKVQAYYHEEGKPTLLELSYYLRKYMERYLNDVALLHNLDRKDIWVFYTIYRTNALHSIKEIEDFTSLSHTAVMLSLQKIFASGYIKLQLDQIPIDIRITSRADKIIKDIEKACHEAEEECLKGFEQKDKLVEELNEFYKKLKDSLPKEEI